ncbi:MAG TPA: hypothetical protein VK854_09180 [Woeseiaceae bacterium]|nr:hypothetical protein [Woeseiaceae bacterium]
MLEESPTITTKRLVAAILIAATLTGCSQTKSWLDSVRGNDPSASDEPVILGAPAADEYLSELSHLSSNDPALQAEIVADSQAAAQLTPNPSTRLRYALVLATPGHPDSDPQQAQSILRELMALPALMTPAEVALATIYLKSSEELILLNSETRRLRASSDRTQRTEEAAISQRLATVEAENRQLRRDLQEAEDKLEAITSIERSIREQE